MKAICLIADDRALSDLEIEHGLSFYIETPGFKLLLDTGKSGLFTENAQKLGVDLANIDFLVISHGHYDHTGGLLDFFKINKRAKVIIRREALAKKLKIETDGTFKSIGMPNRQKLNKFADRFIFSEDCFRVAENIWILSGFENDLIKHKFYILNLMGRIKRDPFADEQIIVVKENDRYNIFTGCSHNGILQIVEFVKKRFYTDKINVLVGGFHLNDKSQEEQNLVAEKMQEYGINRIYTGHCSSVFATNTIVKAELFGSGTEIEF